MPLQPIVFQTPRRDPSLVSQAIVTLGLGLLQKKFIDDPTAKRKEEAFVANREDVQAQQTSERIAEAAETRAEGRRAGVTRPIELATLKQARQDLVPALPGQGGPRQGQIDLIQSLDPDFEPAEASNLRVVQEAGFKRRGSLIDDLLAQARTDAQVAATDASGRDRMLELLSRFSLRPDQLEPFLVKDPGTSETRFPTNNEIGLNTISVALSVGELAGIETDTQFAPLIAQAAELKERTVLVPAYSAETEIEVMGKVLNAKPGADTARDLLFVSSLLRSVGEVGGGGPGEDLWFINDAGEKVLVKSEEQFFFEFPTQTRSRIRGALWASGFFQDPTKFEAAKQQYGLSDPIAEKVYRKITKSSGGSAGFVFPGLSSVSLDTLEGSLAELQAGVPAPPTPATKSRAEQTEAFISPGAQAMIEADSNVVSNLEAFTSRFEADPNAYYQVVAEAEALLNLPDEDLRKVLEDSGVLLSSFEKAEGVKRSGIRGDSLVVALDSIPQRDSLRLSWNQVFDVARIESQARRKAKSQ